ncbi:MAG: NAD kinase [Actinomycetales bacterium]
MSRKIILVLHPTRDEAHALAQEIVNDLNNKNFAVLTSSIVDIAGVVKLSDSELIAQRNDAELVLVLGGDGTILRGAEIAHGSELPVLGINLGHVGFLAQIEKPSIAILVDAISNRSYSVEKRMTLAYKVERGDSVLTNGWALNEVAVERNTEAMIELFVQIDHRPLSRWGCDGVICATPTGSTAYAFSAGGPVVWPDVDALVLLPLAAHALFSDPMVVSPRSQIAIDVESEIGVLSADGLRKVQLVEGDRIILTSEKSFISLAHIDNAPFTDRLVAKFKLPVDGWRGK